MVNSTLADVKTTTTRPSTKRTVSMGVAGSVWRSLGHILSIAARSHPPHGGEMGRLYEVPEVTLVTVAPGGSANSEAAGDEE